MSLKIALKEKLGVDKAIAFSSGARVVQAITGPLSIIFIARFLSGIEQGFYYTFGSLLAIQVFFELGLSGIITQFVAHEAYKLKLINADYEGDESTRSRLSSLLHFSVKWYFVISSVAFVLLIIVGFVFFSFYNQNSSDVEWKLPWILICVGTALKLFQSPIMSFVQGLGMVKEVNKVMFIQQIILPLSTWVGLFFNFKLYVVGVSSILAVLIWNAYCLRTQIHTILKNIWKVCIDEKVDYMKEIFPMQWRIALSWISGYFIFQLFNPVLFATEGAVIAGQMGMTMSMLSALQAFTQSWINTKVPLFSGLIAQKKYVELDAIFGKTMKQMICIGMLLLILFALFLFFIQYFDVRPIGLEIGSRFLPIGPCLLMTLATFTMFPVNCWATYLRCHKKEPLMWNSIVVALLCCASTLGLGSFCGLYGMVLGFACIRFISLMWIYFVYKKKKYEWHK